MKTFLLFATVFFCYTTAIYAQEHKRNEKLPLGTTPKSFPSVKPLSEGGKEELNLSPKYNLEVQKPSYQKVNFDYKPEAKTGFINKPYAKFIVPATLISYGVVTRLSKPMRQLDYSTDHEIGEHYSKGTWVDDYLQFAPAVAVYGLDFAGVPAKHNFRDRTLIMATSYLVMGATVETMKTKFNVARPNDKGTSSFPSGHTAAAFVGAHILMKEYKDVTPWIGIAGYTAATGVGTMRIFNHKHWVSDVVTGAGIGILSAEVGYMMLPVWHKVLGIKDKDKSLVVVPTAVPDMQGHMGYGVGMAYNF